MGDFDIFFQGSSKKILSLVKNLPETGKIEDVVSKATRLANSFINRKRKRFNKHPRRLSEGQSNAYKSEDEKSKASVEVLKTPTCQDALTDSSDEYCDVTIRKDDVQLNEDEDIEISDQILSTVSHKATGYNKANKTCNKIEKERQNSVKRLDKKEDKPRKSSSAVERSNEDGAGTDLKIYLDRKVIGIIEQSLQTLDDIGMITNFGVEIPDGSEDYERKKKRAIEFSCRFARIYLYQLNRHISEIRDILKPATGKGSHRSNAVTLNQKFLTAHQSILHGLQAYQKHLPTSVIINVADKFKDMLKSVCSLCDVYRNNADDNDAEDHRGDIIDALDSKCKALLERMVESPSISKTVVRPNSSNVSLSASKACMRSKQGKDKRLSMYHQVPVRNDVYWKKAIACIAQKKFDVPSRYKTASFKHRPPPPPSPPPPTVQENRIGAHRCLQKSADKKGGSANCKCHRVKDSANDIDDITTLIESQSEKEKVVAHELNGAGSNVMWNLAQGFFEKIFKDDQVMSHGQYQCILQHFISIMQDNKKCANVSRRDMLEQEAQELLEEKLGAPIESIEFKDFVDKLVEYANNSGTGNNQNKELEGICAAISDTNFSTKSNVTKISKSSQKPPSITITGAKNAQLICIKDDNSLLENAEEAQISENERNLGKPNLEVRNARNCENIDSGNVLIYREIVEDDPAKVGPKLARMNKRNFKPLTMLSNDAVVRVIEYKLQFHKETKNNCMYKKSGKKSPWVLVDCITEELMDEALQSIARDIQVDGILKKIYAHEFK